VHIAVRCYILYRDYPAQRYVSVVDLVDPGYNLAVDNITYYELDLSYVMVLASRSAHKPNQNGIGGLVLL
jgi:hypothetical protein